MVWLGDAPIAVDVSSANSAAVGAGIDCTSCSSLMTRNGQAIELFTVNLEAVEAALPTETQPSDSVSDSMVLMC